MKGLIRNNFYTVEGSLKSTLLISLIAAVVLAIVAMYNSDSGFLLSGIIGGNLAGFGALAMTAIQKDAASKWNKFELTMPVRRRDVITARYISCLLYVLIGIVMALVSALPFHLATGALNLERLSYGFVFGWGFALSMPTFVIPLVLILGTDKTEPIIVVSIIAGLVLFFGYSAVCSPFFSNLEHSDFLFRLSYVIFCTVLFVLSYLISCRLYRKKEL